MRDDLVREHRARNTLQSALILMGMLGLLAALGWLIAGVLGMLFAVGACMVMVVLGPTISPGLILRMYRAQEIHPRQAPRLAAYLQVLADRAGLSAAPRLFYVPSRMLNAFAVGTSNAAAIALTDGLLRGLTLREITGVLAHEISHVKSDDITVMTLADLFSRLTSFLSTFGIVLLFLNLPLVLLSDWRINWGAVFLLIIAPSISSLLQLALSRTREYEADRSAVTLSGDPLGLASALVKLECYQGGLFEQILLPGRRLPEPSVLRTHPPTEERVRRLQSLVDQVPEKLPRRFTDIASTERVDRGLQSLSDVARRPRWRVTGLWY